MTLFNAKIGLLILGLCLIFPVVAGATISTNYFLDPAGLFRTSDQTGYTSCTLLIYNDWYPATTTPEGIGGTLCTNFELGIDLDDWTPTFMGKLWFALGKMASPPDFVSIFEYIDICRYGVDDWSDEPCPSEIEITWPTAGSTASSTFTAQISYYKKPAELDKILLVFENWEELSTCPVYGTPEWQAEYDLGYFNYQSYPYFSEILPGTTEIGTTTIEVSNLDENLYNCVRCIFFSESTGEGSTEKCEDYTLTISGFIPPSQPLPIKKWVDYYALHSDPKYATSTEIFNTISSAFDTIVQKVGSFLVDFRVIFDTAQAKTKGEDLGGKIPLARGYLKPINDFFGGTLPISELFIFSLLILIIVGVFRIIKIIIQFIR